MSSNLSWTVLGSEYEEVISQVGHISGLFDEISEYARKAILAKGHPLTEQSCIGSLFEVAGFHYEHLTAIVAKIAADQKKQLQDEFAKVVGAEEAGLHFSELTGSK